MQHAAGVNNDLIIHGIELFHQSEMKLEIMNFQKQTKGKSLASLVHNTTIDVELNRNCSPNE